MKALTLLLPLALIACGDKTEDTGTEEGTEETVEEAFAPQEGDWTASPLTVTEDSCGFSDMEGSEEESGIANLTLNADGSYTFLVDEEMSFSCALEGMELACEPVSEIEEDEGVTFTYTYNVGLSFSSETSLDGSMGMDFTCEGEGCTLMEESGMTFPCSIAGEFTATANATE